MEEKKITFKEIFDTLNAVNVNDYTEKKKTDFGTELTYLPWASAWELLLKHYPNSTFVIHEEAPNRQCFYDEELGYMVKTSVTVEGYTRTMTLPVMNHANKIMFDHAYTYVVSKGEKKVEKTVERATMFDINTNVMRCLVKTIALFGLGLYVYRGEDLPSGEAEKVKAETKKKIAEMKESVIKAIDNAKTAREIGNIFKNNPILNDDKELYDYGMAKATELNAANGN